MMNDIHPAGDIVVFLIRINVGYKDVDYYA